MNQPLKVTASHMAGIAPPLKSRMDKAKGGFMQTALGVAVMAAGFFGIAGISASYFIERHKNQRAANRQLDVLADYYRAPVAAQLGIDPNSVNVKDLALAARVNPQIANAIAKVDREKNSQNRIAGLAATGGAVGGAALAGAGWLPGVSGISHTVSHGIAHAVGSVGGSVAGIAANPLFDKKVLATQDVVEQLDAKRKADQPVTTEDIFMLRLAQDEKLQAQIKKDRGTHFHKMNPAQQTLLMQAMPEMMQAAEADAQLVNAGRIDPAGLIVQSPGSWANRVGGPRAMGSGFMQQEQARRAAQQQAAMAGQAM